MDYRRITKQIIDVRREIRASIPNYWQLRIDKIIDIMPDKMKELPDLFLYVHKDTIDCVGWKYRNIELMQIRPIDESVMYLTEHNIFWTDNYLIDA